MIDKFLYVGCLIVLLFKYAYWPLLAFSMTVDFLILLIALFVILAGRKNKLIAADKIGKVKMFFQILTLVTILFSLIFSTNWLLTLSLIILLVSISLQLISSLNYLIKFIIS